MPIFLADLGFVVQDGLATFGADGFAPGDVVLVNHPRVCGQHLNNIVTYTPLFWEGELVAFPAARAHWIDVGGLSTGFGASNSRDVYQEGLQIRAVKIYEGGRPNEAVLNLIRDNVRFPESSFGDLRAQIAACRLGERRLAELLARYGLDTVRACIERIYADSERLARRTIERIPDGVYEAESFLDNDGVRLDRPVPIRVQVTVAGDEMTIDYAGTSAGRRRAAEQRPDRRRDHGGAGRLQVRGGARRAGQRGLLPAAPRRAAARLLPRRRAAGADGRLQSGFPDDHRHDPARAGPRPTRRHSGGAQGRHGARPDLHGCRPAHGRALRLREQRRRRLGRRPAPATARAPGRRSPRATSRTRRSSCRRRSIPLRVEYCQLRAGQRRRGHPAAGLGVDTVYRALADMTVKTRLARTLCPPWGLDGGQPGEIATIALQQPGGAPEAVQIVTAYPLRAGGEATFHTAGGGGWGDPFRRDPALVAADVRDGYVSGAAARAAYGVVVDPTTGAVDAAATAALRAAHGEAGGGSGA